MTSHTQTPNEETKDRVFFIMPGSLAWWVWLVTATLLAAGLAGYRWGFITAIAISVLQTIVFWLKDGGRLTFPVQLRVAYTALLLVCSLPYMQWLFWLPTAGTYALNIFGYCLMARCLSLLPWNRREPISFDLIGRAFLSRPSIDRVETDGATGGCPGGLCSIEAQVRQKALAR